MKNNIAYTNEIIRGVSTYVHIRNLCTDALIFNYFLTQKKLYCINQIKKLISYIELGFDFGFTELKTQPTNS